MAWTHLQQTSPPTPAAGCSQQTAMVVNSHQNSHVDFNENISISEHSCRGGGVGARKVLGDPPSPPMMILIWGHL